MLEKGKRKRKVEMSVDACVFDLIEEAWAFLNFEDDIDLKAEVNGELKEDEFPLSQIEGRMPLIIISEIKAEEVCSDSSEIKAGEVCEANPETGMD